MIKKCTALVLLGILFITASCNKYNDPSAEDDIDDVVLTVNAMAELSYFAHSMLEGNAWSNLNCATYDSTNGEITLDFGNLECADANNRVRSGSLILTYEDSTLIVGSQFTLAADDYTLSDYRFNGEIDFIITEQNTTERKVKAVSDMTVRVPDNNRNIIYGSTETQTVSQGFNDGNASNNSLIINPGIGGNTGTGLGFTIGTLEDFHFGYDCPYITQGRFEITSESFELRTLTFGDGSCDDLVQSALGQIIRDIRL